MSKTNEIIKRVILTIGLLILGFVIILNLIYQVEISSQDESVSVSKNKLYVIVIAFIVELIIIALCKKNEKVNKNYKKIFFICCIILYAMIQILWINCRRIYPVNDQEYTYLLAERMYTNNANDFLSEYNGYFGRYFEKYPYNLVLAWLWSLLFKMYNMSSPLVIQYFNVIANVLSLIAIYLIMIELEKKYKINKVIGIIFFVLFIPLTLLSTFTYGDEVAITTSLFGVYWGIRFKNEKKYKYIILATIMMALSRFFRVNTIIVIIAIGIYLCLDVVNNKNKIKEILLILCFIIMTIMPYKLVENVLMSNYKLRLTEEMPMSERICIGISDSHSYRAPGWYNDEIAKVGLLKSNDIADEVYKEMNKERISYFIHNPLECASFFIKKITSMWAENTCGAVWYNNALNSQDNTFFEKKNGDAICRIQKFIIVYQKILMLLIFINAFVNVIKNRKQSDEIILLLLIFIGGFVVHAITEAKSRYILSYIVALIPIAAVKDSYKIDSISNILNNRLKCDRNRRSEK